MLLGYQSLPLYACNMKCSSKVESRRPDTPVASILLGSAHSGPMDNFSRYASSLVQRAHTAILSTFCVLTAIGSPREYPGGVPLTAIQEVRDTVAVHIKAPEEIHRQREERAQDNVGSFQAHYAPCTPKLDCFPRPTLSIRGREKQGGEEGMLTPFARWYVV